MSGSRFFYLKGAGALLEFALLNLAMQQAVAARPHADDHAQPGAAQRHGGHGLPRPGRRERVPRRAGRHVPRRDVRGAAGRLPRRRDHRRERAAAALRRLVHLLPTRGRLVRQGHPRHHPRPPVRQGGDVRLLPPGGRRGRARPPARLGARVRRRPRDPVPRHRRRHGRPRLERRAQVRHGGVDPHSGHLPRDHLDLQHHGVPGAPAAHPDARRAARPDRWPPSTARCAPCRASSSRSSRTTSRPTAASASRWPSGRSSAVDRSSRPSDSVCASWNFPTGSSRSSSPSTSTTR